MLQVQSLVFFYHIVLPILYVNRFFFYSGVESIITFRPNEKLHYNIDGIEAIAETILIELIILK